MGAAGFTGGGGIRGHRLSQFWEWTLSAWFCIFLCGLTVFVVYHGIIAFRLF